MSGSISGLAFGRAAIVVFAALLTMALSRDPSAAEEAVHTHGPAPDGATLGAVLPELLALAESETPKAALVELRRRMAADDALAASCHPIVHAIGRAAFARFGDFAQSLLYQDEVCNSGYLHGVIEGFFSAAENVDAAMATACGETRPQSFESWECHHGVGHGIMIYAANDLDRSLELCDSYDDRFAGASCANGVFMEYFNPERLPATAALADASELFAPCDERKRRHRPDCYLYLPVVYLQRRERDYAGALRWCETAKRAYRSTCAKGVGGQAVKENINDPKAIERVCMGASAPRVKDCIGGMVGLFMNHHGGLAPARALCAELEPANRRNCNDIVDARARLFAS